MKALYLSGDPKTMIDPLTDSLPKSMIPIMNRPLLERSIAGLRRWGVDEVLIGIAEGSKVIREYFGDGSRFGIKINYAVEEPSHGIGRVLKTAGNLFKEPFFVFSQDVLCNMDLDVIMRAHRSGSAGITVAAAKRDNPNGNVCIKSDISGCSAPDDRNRNSEKGNSKINSTGVYVVEPSVLNGIPEGMQFSLVRDFFPALMGNGVKIAACQGCTYWMDMKTPEQYLQVHKDILAGNYRISGVHFHDRSVFKDGNSIVDSTAVITGPVYLGDHVKIGAYATIGPNAVIGDDVVVHMGGRVINSVVWESADVGICAKLNGSIATSGCKVKRKTAYTDTALTNAKSVVWKKNSARSSEKFKI